MRYIFLIFLTMHNRYTKKNILTQIILLQVCCKLLPSQRLHLELWRNPTNLGEPWSSWCLHWLQGRQRPHWRHGNWPEGRLKKHWAQFKLKTFFVSLDRQTWRSFASQGFGMHRSHRWRRNWLETCSHWYYWPTCGAAERYFSLTSY